MARRYSIYDVFTDKKLSGNPLAVIFDAGKWITAIILAILGGAFIVRAFDVDRTLSSLGRLTPTSFIKIVSVIAGVLILLASNANGQCSSPGWSSVNVASRPLHDATDHGRIQPTPWTECGLPSMLRTVVNRSSRHVKLQSATRFE